MSSIPELRLRAVNDAPISSDGEFVLYWMIANRRLRWNFALDRALERARELDKPLLIFEALRSGYRWASDRLHRFVLQGMAEHEAALRDGPVGYYPYVEPNEGAGKGLLEALASRAAVVVTDDFPCFFLPRMVEAVAPRLECRLEIVDSNGLLPMRAADKVMSRAYDFRRFLQRELPPHLLEMPAPDPLEEPPGKTFDLSLEKIQERWPATTPEELKDPAFLASLPIDHEVGPGLLDGGGEAAAAALREFLSNRLSDYPEERNHPDENAPSGLSPYLHFGHLAAHQIFVEMMEAEDWNPQSLSDSTSGAREGWWGASAGAEAFLDQVVTWREVGFNFCWQRDDYDRFSSLPAWARKTLAEHADDPRETTYSLDELAQAKTHDELWNAAQRQLVSEGRMHNYLRMVWGKSVLAWSRTPQEALEVLIELNNRYAVDGRNPNSYSGIFWCLGRYDRAWGPERPIFGKVRYMSLDNTRRKLRLKEYLKRYGDQAALDL